MTGVDLDDIDRPAGRLPEVGDQPVLERRRQRLVARRASRTSSAARAGCRRGRRAPRSPRRPRCRSGRARSEPALRPCRCRTCRATSARGARCRHRATVPDRAFERVLRASRRAPPATCRAPGRLRAAPRPTRTRDAQRARARVRDCRDREPAERMAGEHEPFEAGLVGRVEHRGREVPRSTRTTRGGSSAGPRRRGSTSVADRPRARPVDMRQHRLPAPRAVAPPCTRTTGSRLPSVTRLLDRRGRPRSPGSGSPARRARSCRRARRGVDDDRDAVVVEIEHARRPERAVARAHARFAVDPDLQRHSVPSSGGDVRSQA